MADNQKEVAAKAAASQKDPRGVDHYTVASLVGDNVGKHIIASPREYQLEMFERAKKKNIIVVLDTGSGKTLIAALLLRHTIEQELEHRAIGREKKVAFFLVEKVALCLQQWKVLDQNLEYPVSKLYGTAALTGNISTKEFWVDQIASNMVIVCTAQILLSALSNGFISISQINLIVFDEAHHTKKNHPYALIIKNYYLRERDQQKRPRILGMTASPVDSQTRDVRFAAAELENILCSEIATVSSRVLEEQATSQKKSEMTETYQRLEAREMACTALWHAIAEVVGYNPDFRAALETTKEAASTLGRWCADRWWKLQMTDADVLKLEALAIGRGDRLTLEEETSSMSTVAQVQKLVHEHKLGSISPEAPELSSKVNVLWNVLFEAFSRGTDRCIVFVEKRYTAALLSDLFAQPTMEVIGMKCGFVVGGSSATLGLGTMSFRDQLVTLAKFRRGEINCLFATPVAEEGIDIPECDLIIRFDIFKSVIQYIQSKGRARRENSRYISLIEDGNLQDRRKMMQAHRDANSLRQFCEALPEDRKVSDVDVISAADSEFAAQRAHEIPSTGARLTLFSSLDVLARFCASFPTSHGLAREDYIVISMGKKFMAELILPEASPIRHVSGHPQRSKHLARCSAAYEACIQLLEKKYIDEHLQPTFKKKINAMRNARLAISSHKKAEYPMRTKPNAWSIREAESCTELLATTVALQDPDTTGRPTCPFVLLTRTALPTLPGIPLYFNNGESTTARPISSSTPVRVTSQDLDRLAKFTLKVFQDVFSKEFEAKPTDLPYFFAPCSNSHAEILSGHTLQLDWDLIDLVQEQDYLEWKGAEEDFFKGKFVIDPHDGSRKIIIHGVNRDLRPSDPTPKGVPEPKCRAYRFGPPIIKEYSSSLWLAARKRCQWSDDQPVINAELLSLRRDFLDEDSAGRESQASRTCYIILEPLRVSPIPIDFVAMSMFIPAILYRIESILIALDGCALLGIDIGSDLALEAMTKDSDNTEEHGEEQLNFQSGMGNNYERLEFLGDSFLKMATTISLFTLLPDNDEAQNHDERMLLVCNQNLFNHAVDRSLFEYVRSKSFDRRTWYPHLKQRKGKAQTTELRHSLADKTIADVCEALIGAAYLSGPDDNLDMAVRAVTCMVKSKYHTMSSFKEYYEKYETPAWQLIPGPAAYFDMADRVAPAIGYKFQSPTLLRSAFKHPSFPYETTIPDYQRLEFLGDALLDMTMVDYLFKMFPGADPQWLTEHKMAMASNQFLGCLCVKLGLHRPVLVTTAALSGQISQYTEELKQVEQEALAEAQENGEEPRRDFWLSASQPPKVLPDVVEALVGAMFVDSKYDYGVVQRFFERHVRPFFADMRLYDTFAKKHPVTGLGRRMVEFGCTRWRLCCSGMPSFSDDNVASAMCDKDGEVICALVVHGNVLVHNMAKSGRYGKVRVAKLALEKYSEENGWDAQKWRAETGCDCSGEDLQDGLDLEDHGTAV
ncbi:hypothetical protein B0I35DRAFT_349113 [Stachybotrys elegans]|uniref:Dicer-like protein 1 n=1 Tax=Stachybotrys elegans TaxID=80388 RepID=A0A8K0WU21_9HYPO|nr:hypothetical protein B0I35DRAFT_349113 [Stachybotrys elegans]